MESKHMKFWSTINREETQFEADMSQAPASKGRVECLVLTGAHKGETRPYRWLSLNSLWEQISEEGDL